MENFFENTRQWVQGEISESIIIIVSGLLMVALGFVLNHYAKVPGAKALFLPLLVCGVLYTVIGAYNYYGNQGRIEQYEKQYQSNPEEFVKTEKARVEGFQYMYKISKAVARALKKSHLRTDA